MAAKFGTIFGTQIDPIFRGIAEETGCSVRKPLFTQRHGVLALHAAKRLREQSALALPCKHGIASPGIPHATIIE